MLGKLVPVACALLMASATMSNASAAVISWDYANGNPVDGTAGVVPAPGWNSTGDAGSPDLTYSDGTSSGASLSLAGGFGAWGIGSVNSPDADGTYNKAVLDGYYNSLGSTLTLGNIPFAQYDVYVYISADVDGRTGTVSDGPTTYSFSTMAVAATSGANSANPDAVSSAILTQTTDTGTGDPAADYAVFSGLSGASQTLTIANASDGMGFAGVQIVQTPEPASLALLGLGAVAAFGRRRSPTRQ